ncbi:orf101 [Artaxa digramma nucleopolyhedrovirus]|uniref:Orf101 n=1 Tax=Artaxa digramma nucleopolyhedrovirus TaxID=3070910 RepID=A0AAE6UZP2_9ABAC|nr:orf101 [Euproctis digramma nucleopolyhedrovirus]QHB21760.1 orf101 [Artaxa digramma nucleopolyhedrovirus]
MSKFICIMYLYKSFSVMVYRSVAQLPIRLQNCLPLKAQLMYMHVYNSGFSVLNNPSRAAWSVIKKYYYKSADGKWKRKRIIYRDYFESDDETTTKTTTTTTNIICSKIKTT